MTNPRDPRRFPPNSGRARAVVLAGPNGAGKTTAAPRLLKGALKVTEFLNADLIARGLSPFEPEGAALAASEVLLRRMESLAEQRISFGFETTLAARSWVSRFRALGNLGYDIHLVFFWLPSADFAVARVADRVSSGGHNVPEADIRRRFQAGLTNFFKLYLPLTTTWRMYNNCDPRRRTLIAAGKGTAVKRLGHARIWEALVKNYL